MPMNWESTDTWQRLVAAIIATGVKIDLHEVAKMYGTTYDTIQNRYRKIRLEANQLKDEVDSGKRGEVTPKKPKSATSTPRKTKATKDALSTVTNGRVTKTASPKKSKTVKQEKADDATDGGIGNVDIFDGIDFGADSGDMSMGLPDFGS